jgi:hypothetical protein
MSEMLPWNSYVSPLTCLRRRIRPENIQIAGRGGWEVFGQQFFCVFCNIMGTAGRTNPNMTFGPLYLFLCCNSRWQRVPETREPDGFYPINKRVWNDFSTCRYVIGRDSLPVGYDGHGCGCVLPMPAYPRVKITRQNNKSQGHFGQYKSRNWPIKLA